MRTEEGAQEGTGSSERSLLLKGPSKNGKLEERLDYVNR